MTIFIDVVLPVLLVFAIGYTVQKWQNASIKSVSIVAIYIATPALVFQTFYTAEIDQQYFYMVVFSFILFFALIALNKIAAKLTGASAEKESGWILATAFMNAGNYGAPIILFAYGEEGFAFAVSFMVLQAIMMNLFGVYYAAKGNAGSRYAIRSVFTMPVTYAVILAMTFQITGLSMPENLLGTVDILAEAAIPLVMVILGMQLATMSFGQLDWGSVSYSVIVRLLVSPVIAFGIVQFMPLEPLLANVLIISAATPSAATIVMYAVQFDNQPRYVSSVTLVSTLLSIVTITLLLMMLE